MSTRLHAARPADLHAWRSRALPPLGLADRVALRIGLALIVWGRRHGEPVDRAVLLQRRSSRAGLAAAELAHDRAAARRLAGGQIV